MKAIRHLLAVRQRFGWSAAFALVVDRFAGMLLHLDLNRMFLLEVENLGEVAGAPSHLECRFLSAQEVRNFSQDPANDLSDAMADRIERGRDFCFAVLDQGALLSYGWYALGGIEAEHNKDVAMSLPADCVYMYKAFTLPAQRGRRLDSLGRSLALQALARRGVRRMVATVHWTNWPSLRSFRRLGCVELGFLYTIGPRRWSIIGAPRSAAAKGIRFSRSRGDAAVTSESPKVRLGKASWSV